jgi:hypothetical protein
VVDCDLLEARSQRRVRRGDRHAPNFGKAGAATIVDPGVLSGWGVRPSDYQTTVSVQQQIVPRVSADFSFSHRSFQGFFRHRRPDRRGNINSYYETYTLTAPQDSRLPTAAVTRSPSSYRRQRPSGAPQRILIREKDSRCRALSVVGRL